MNVMRTTVATVVAATLSMSAFSVFANLFKICSWAGRIT